MTNLLQDLVRYIVSILPLVKVLVLVLLVHTDDHTHSLKQCLVRLRKGAARSPGYTWDGSTEEIALMTSSSNIHQTSLSLGLLFKKNENYSFNVQGKTAKTGPVEHRRPWEENGKFYNFSRCSPRLCLLVPVLLLWMQLLAARTWHMMKVAGCYMVWPIASFG